MKKVRFLIPIFTLIILVSYIGIGTAQDLAIENGINWLTVNQNVNGSWGGEVYPSTLFRDTCVVVNTLYYLSHTDTPYSNGLTWIDRTDPVNTDYLARKIESLSKAGNDTRGLMGLLLSYQNSDGGWGLDESFGSEPLRTVLALRALDAASYSDAGVIKNGIIFLLDKQKWDGSWSFVDGADGDIYLTALVLQFLQKYRNQYNLSSWLDKSAAWLLAQMNPDGSFGSSIYETALAYSTLIKQPSANSQQLTATLGYIESKQQKDGSWNGNAYETALALRALKDSAPDIAISSEDVSFSPQVPIEGQPVTITATIHNKGGRPVNDVVVKLGVRSSEFGVKTIPTIAVGGSEAVEFSWLAKSGMQEFEILVDPENLIQETIETNNSIYFFLTPGTKPDLTLSNQDITFNPSTPQVGDPQLIISANIYNKGETPADNFRVELTANGQQLTAYNITTIPGGRYVRVQALITGPLPEGSYNIEVIIDPTNVVEETNETNNTTSRSITIGGGPAPVEPDLSISSNDITFTPKSPTDEEQVRIETIVRNIGKGHSQNVIVKFFDGHPVMGGAFLGKDEKDLLEGGNSFTFNIGSILLVPGSHSIYVVLETSSKEATMINNQAHALLKVTPTPPSPPTGLIATPLDSIIDLSWNPNPEKDVAGYNLYREEGGGMREKVNIDPITTTGYRDMGLTIREDYYSSGVFRR